MAIDIKITDLTNLGEIKTDTNNPYTIDDATGVFDRLMRSTLAHINAQIDENRITQSEAGQVYSAGISAVISQSIQYILQEKQIEAQVDLIKQQTLTEVQNTDNANKQGVLLDTEEAIKNLEEERLKRQAFGRGDMV